MAYQDSFQKITHHLSRFGEVKPYEYEFSDKVEAYAGWEIITEIPIAKGLESEINTELKKHKIPARLRFLDVDYQQDHKIRYDAEIIPQESDFDLYNFKKAQTLDEKKAEATENCIDKIPSILKQIRQKKIDLRKKGKQLLDTL